MQGNTNDLTPDSEFISKAYRLIRRIEESQPPGGYTTTEADIIRCIGIKRTNANDLSSIDLDSGVALYPTYTLMNSHCYCNTRCALLYLVENE